MKISLKNILNSIKDLLSPILETYKQKYDRGYYSAQRLIKKGENPQVLYYQSVGGDAFDVGWRVACLDNGAKDYD